MKKTTHSSLASLLLILTIGCLFTPTSEVAGSSIPTVDHSKGIQFKRPPLRFEINEGQVDRQVRFMVRDRDGIAYLTSDGAVFQISRVVGTPEAQPRFKKASYTTETSGFESSFVRMKIAGANPNPRVVGLDRLPGVTNYFLGNDPTKWRTEVAGYAKVKYEGVYPGIDLIYYDNGEGRLEYDFIVAPGADPKQIALSIEDAQSLEVDSSGDLVITAATGTIRKPAPKVYQEIDGKRQEIAAAYRLIDAFRFEQERTEKTEQETAATSHSSLDPRRSSPRPSTLAPQHIAFAVGAYDRNKPLVIDPQIIYATYLGGSSTSTVANEGARGVAVDAQGSVYVVGVTISTNFPTKNAAQNVLKGFSNAFITKLDANGQLVYSTYLGGSGFDEGTVIKVDETGAVYVGGTTGSIDFPTVNPALKRGGRNDVFITKLSAAGSQIVYSTYLGGTDNDSVEDLTLDAEKNVYIVGNIAPALGVPANDFPVVNPIQSTHGGGLRDGFVSVISANGSSLLFSTYLGGDGDDFFQSVAVDPQNWDLYVGYFTDSSNFSVSSSTQVGTQAFATVPRGGVTRYKRRFPDIVWDRKNEVARIVLKNGVTVDQEYRVSSSLTCYIICADTFAGFLSLDTDFGNPPQNEAALQIVQPQAFGGLDSRLHLFDRNLIITKTTFFGGSGEETVSGLATDSKSAAYIIGNTRSTDLSVVNPIQATRSGGDASFEGFLAVFAPGTLQPLFATYLGGTGMEFLNGVTVDPQGNIYVVGETFGGFPAATQGALQSQLSGRTDAFIIKISPVAISSANVPVDFDGDRKSDIGIYRSGVWFVLNSSGGSSAISWGGAVEDIPVQADYDGDGKADHAVYRSGNWFIRRSTDIGMTYIGWGGAAEDIPVQADYDGDGITDVAVYRSGNWFIRRSTDGGMTYIGWGGAAEDIPVQADYDGDGKADVAVYRGGNWFIRRSTDSGMTVVSWGGAAEDIPVQADYDGDGKADQAVYRGGNWFIRRSTDGGLTYVAWGGAAQDIPVPADYDGDGKTDVSVFRDGNWFIRRSSDTGTTFVGWGTAGDLPIN